MKMTHLGMAAALALALAAPVGAQAHDPNGDGNGHEKCIGEGHDQDPACRGPVGNTVGIVGDQTYCDSHFAQQVESSWRRVSCELAQESTAYGDAVLVYSETTGLALFDYADGALGLVQPPPAPTPQVVPGDYVLYAETTANSLLGYADGALGLVQPPPAPTPQVVPGDYVTYVGTTSTSLFDYANGALGLVQPPPAPTPQVVPGDYVTYVGTTSTSLLDYANGALGLVQPPPAPTPQVVPDPTSLLNVTAGSAVGGIATDTASATSH